MAKEELLTDIIETLMMIGKSKTFLQFQESVKGEKNCLAVIFQNSGECSPGKIAEALDVTAARVAAILKSLESRGLVERFNDVKDKRKTFVKLTETGNAYVEQLGEILFGYAMLVVEKLGEADSVEFIRLLKKILVIKDSIGQKGCVNSENRK